VRSILTLLHRLNWRVGSRHPYPRLRVDDQVFGTGNAGDIFMQAQFPRHSGRILDLPRRILISLIGLVVVMLSVTGVVIRARKRRVQMGGQSNHPQQWHPAPHLRRKRSPQICDLK